jgi:hypothetical protein
MLHGNYLPLHVAYIENRIFSGFRIPGFQIFILFLLILPPGWNNWFTISLTILFTLISYFRCAEFIALAWIDIHFVSSHWYPVGLWTFQNRHWIGCDHQWISEHDSSCNESTHGLAEVSEPAKWSSQVLSKFASSKLKLQNLAHFTAPRKRLTSSRKNSLVSRISGFLTGNFASHLTIMIVDRSIWSDIWTSKPNGSPCQIRLQVNGASLNGHWKEVHCLCHLADPANVPEEPLQLQEIEMGSAE